MRGTHSFRFVFLLSCVASIVPGFSMFASPQAAMSDEAELAAALPGIFEQAAAHYRALDAAATPLMHGGPDGAPQVPHGFKRVEGCLDMQPVYWWTAGHFPGSLWYLYEATGDDFFKDRARAWTELLAPNAAVTDNHDVGFIMYCSFGNARRLLGTRAYDALLLETANSLSRRFSEKLGLIRSWGDIDDETDFLVIPDNLMNLELLEWAAKAPGGDGRFDRIARSHADATMKHHYRPDGGTFHVLNYDPRAGFCGAVQEVRRGQGLSCETAWARGQAWSIYGYTMMFRETRERRYLDFAQKVADYALNHPNMPEDGVPYWDFGAPGEERDTSAAAVMASALLELSTFVGGEKGASYKAFAVRQLLALASPAYFSKVDEIGHWLLKHGVGHKPGGFEIDTPLNYGDYYFLEALLRFRRMSAGTAPAPMTTPWGEKVTDENCWRGYPRPQMVRANWTNLNGAWDYAVTSVTNTPGRPEKWDGQIRVPYPIESALSGVGRLLGPDEFLWYTRKIVCDPKPGDRILLHFGGVDFRTMVFIGHDEVTDVPHEGGNLPFTLDITDYVKKGENELTVCVWDPTEDFVNSRGKQSFRPHECFYTRVSGIWQTVWMETVPETYIKSYKVFTDIDKGTVTLEFKVDGTAGTTGTIEILCAAAPLREKFTPGKPVTIELPAPVALWSPENPHLYDFTAKFGTDEIRGYFGMRKFEKRREAKGVQRFFLNNEPCFLLGTLDQGWWPDGLLTPPSEEAMEYDVKVLKECGFNMLRKHIKVEPQTYYAMCDRVGILVLQDLPSGSESWLDPARADTVKRYHLQRLEMKEMMDDLQPFPSIVMWNPYNEGWSQPGEFLTHSMLDFTRRHDPTRLVNGPSGCWDWEGGHLLPKNWAWTNRVETAHRPEGVCEAADTVDMHLYRGPAMFKPNDRRVSILGEFGGLGHPVLGHVWRDSDQGVSVWGKPQSSADGSWGYGGIEDTKTREGLEKAYLDLMAKVGDMAEKGLGGAIYTQTTDVEIEINGLLTYDRRILKFNPAVLKAAHERVIKRVEGVARVEE